MTLRPLGVLILLAAVVAPLHAHEARPAYLEIKEIEPGRFSVLWRTPVLAGMRLRVALQMPGDVKDFREPTVQELADSYVERRWIDAGAGGLSGKRIAFPGLQLTITDVLVRLSWLDGRTSTVIVHANQPWVDLPAAQSSWEVAGTYVVLGIRHILSGPDHLLFVFGLLLIVANRWMLLKTVTAFTVAHSITLAMATLGVVNIPVLPIDALIALSILFLGPEIVRCWRGETSFTIRNPWVVAFAFGLLHGFGFASVLTSAGLPRSDLPLALVELQRGRGTRAARLHRAGAAARALLPHDPCALAELDASGARICRRLARRLLGRAAGDDDVRRTLTAT